MDDVFHLKAPFQPTGDQPQAIDALVQGINEGDDAQTLLGVTGSGKTFTMANIIARCNRPTLILEPNKTLASQICTEMRSFFPDDAVEYFVSYYDYYQPEAYIPSTDTYIEKDSAINDEIDRLRHSATAALSEQRNVIIVASVSCIYSLGDPIDYRSMVISLRPGMQMERDELCSRLVKLQYERNDMNFIRNKFREYGFRLPSAFDNRPLKFEEFEQKVHQKIFVSATPGDYEREHSSRVAEQVIRPTGLLDPVIMVRPVEGQIEDLLGEIRVRIDRGERALVTTLTVKMAEDLTDYLEDHGVKTKYMHHEVDTFERMEIIKDLRVGAIDVIVGINLLREGLDLPEVSLIAILDADKEGFLRSETSLIQTIGRAARNANGVVLMYADEVTPSMERAIMETERRRAIQDAYNKEHGITPKTHAPAPYEPRGTPADD